MGATGGRVEANAVVAKSGLSGVPTASVATWWPVFRRRCPRLAVGIEGFQALFATLLPDASPAALAGVFLCMDSSGRGLIDGLEFFAALTLLSRGTLAVRAELLFAMFDLAGRGHLDRAALGLLLDRAASGLMKSCTCHGLNVPDRLPRAMADYAFRGRPSNEAMSRPQFTHWWQRSAPVRRVLWKLVLQLEEEAGLPSEDEWCEEHYKELEVPQAIAWTSDEVEAAPDAGAKEEEAAMKIQSMYRRKSAKSGEERSAPDAAAFMREEEKEDAANTQTMSDELMEPHDASALEEDPLLKHGLEEHEAATKIQSMYRRRSEGGGKGNTTDNATAPEEAPLLKGGPQKDEEEAATKIQTMYRRRSAKATDNATALEEAPLLKRGPQKDEDEAATKIQSMYRRRSAKAAEGSA